jgi:hypothetical protein
LSVFDRNLLESRVFFSRLDAARDGALAVPNPICFRMPKRYVRAAIGRSVGGTEIPALAPQG